MATNAVQVSADQAGEAGVIERSLKVDGMDVSVYLRIEHTDDLDGKSAEDVQTVQFAIPVEDKDEDSGETFWRMERREIDLSKANRTKLETALRKYVEASREVKARVPATRTGGGANAEVKAWNERVKSWLRGAGHEVADRGRIPQNLVEIYMKNHPSDTKPE